MLVSPSILAADFLNLGKDIELLNTNADFIHLDVMDGTFVPNISFGFSVIDQVSEIARIPMDTHLMVVQPWKWFRRLADDGVRMVSFHLEATEGRCAESLDELHSLGIKAGLAINPDVRVENLYPFIGKADFFLIMSVFAGFGGQRFMPDALSRVRKLKDELKGRGDSALIEVDGGVGMDNIADLKDAGADIVVAGSSVFKSQDPGEAIASLRACRK